MNALPASSGRDAEALKTEACVLKSVVAPQSRVKTTTFVA
jgi:hypothetical protein